MSIILLLANKAALASDVDKISLSKIYTLTKVEQNMVSKFYVQFIKHIKLPFKIYIFDGFTRAEKNKLCPFYLPKLPKISFMNYIDRIKTKIFSPTNCFKNTMIVAFIYMNKYKEVLHINGLQINTNSVHQLFAISMRLADKFLNDNFFDNKFWATIAGIDIRHFNKLEKDFLKLINYELFVNRQEFQDLEAFLRD